MGYCFHIFPGLKAGAALRPCLCGIGSSRGIKSTPFSSGLSEMKSTVTLYDTRPSRKAPHDQAKRPTSRGTRRQQSSFNTSTGMIYTQSKEPKRKRPIWPWIVISFILVALLSRAFPGNNAVPASAPTPGLVIASPAVIATPKPTVIITQAPVITPPPTSSTLSNNSSPTATPVKELARGVKGDEVKALQEKLISLDYLPEGQADGVFGRDTQKAVKEFQEKNGLEADGVAGEKTLTVLYGGNAKKK